MASPPIKRKATSAYQSHAKAEACGRAGDDGSIKTKQQPTQRRDDGASKEVSIDGQRESSTSGRRRSEAGNFDIAEFGRSLLRKNPHRPSPK